MDSYQGVTTLLVLWKHNDEDYYTRAADQRHVDTHDAAPADEERKMKYFANRCLAIPAIAALMAATSAADEPLTLENLAPVEANDPDEPIRDEFSMEAAVRFLDAVALNWRKERECFACHVDYAYLCSRPLVSWEAPAHKQLRSKLEQLAEHPPEAKYPVMEAVMAASTLAQNDALTTGKLHPATRQALDRMWKMQREDGGFDWKKSNQPPSEIDDHYGVTMAAIGVGVAPDGYADTPAAKAGLDRIRAFFKNNPPANLHHRAMKLLASLHVDGIMTESQRRQVVEDLFALQKPDGGWGLATIGNWARCDDKPQDMQSSDGYGTGFAIYILRQAGVPAEDPRIQKGIAWLKTHQRASGRWFTRSMWKDSEHYITHVGVAYAILALTACGEKEKNAAAAAPDQVDEALLTWTECPSNPVLTPGPPGAWDDHIRERMWVIREDGQYHGWYCGWQGEYDKRRPRLVQLGYAASSDGVKWTKHPGNPIFTERWVEDVCVLKVGDTYYMYAEDETLNKTAIHLLTSKDGLNWTMQGNVLERRKESNWENEGVGTPVVWREGVRWLMLYEGGGPGDIGLAVSKDGKTWVRNENNPVLRNSDGGGWDNRVVGPSSILKRGELYHLFYIACGDSFHDGIAFSRDLVRWRRYQRNPVVEGRSAVVVDAGDKYFLYTLRGEQRRTVNLYVASKRN